jgi:hypothetical protein
MFLITKYPQMKYTVITTFHPAGMELYGQRMIDTFEQHWPDSVELVVYAENCVPRTTKSNVRVVNLLDLCPELVEFKHRHANNPRAHGQILPDGSGPIKDNSFKWDAVRFSHKVFSVIHACENIDSDWIIWLDADSKTFQKIPEDFLASVCDDSAMVCYLGRREKYHSECGWVAYNRRHSMLSRFIADWKDLYTTDRLFTLTEYHDSFVFDVLRKQYQSQGIRFHNLSPEVSGKGPGHPFIASALGRYIDHLKGSRRKEMGRSAWKGDDESAAFHPDVSYWSGQS